MLVSFLQALTSPDLVQRLAARRITSFGMEGIPRISRAQKMDALSSQANIAGYKAVLIAAESLAKFFPMLMTAAGTVFAARVLVIGAGVAGLQAIATARRLGAQVWGYDVRAVGEGAGREPRRQVPRVRPGHRRRRGQGRLRQGAVRRREPPAAGAARREDEGLRRRHHHGAGARPARAAPRHRRRPSRACGPAR